MNNIFLFTIALLSFLIFPIQSRADNTPSAPSPARGGFYVGGYGGYGWNDVDSDLAGGLDFDDDEFEYGAFVGVQVDQLLGRTMGRAGVGMTGAVEVYYTESDAEETKDGITMEKDYDWGINFRPGLTFLDQASSFGIKPYGILGYRRTNFQASGGGASVDEEYNGFELGLGSELMAYNAFGVRLDYTHVFYKEDDGLDPSEDNLRLGVAYHF